MTGLSPSLGMSRVCRGRSLRLPLFLLLAATVLRCGGPASETDASPADVAPADLPPIDVPPVDGPLADVPLAQDAPVIPAQDTVEDHGAEPDIPPDVPVAPADASREDIDFATATARARALGAYLQPIATSVAEEVANSGGDRLEALCSALPHHFGPRQGHEDHEDGWLTVGGAFRYHPGTCNNLNEAVCEADGRAELVVGSLTADFFYEYTVVELCTGAVYQSCRGVNSGCDTQLLEWFGPLQPPVDARVIGQFSPEQLRELAAEIACGIDPRPSCE